MILVLLSISLIGQSQNPPDLLKQIVPLSPNAAAIAKYGEIPVGHFTGVPNINIPLHTIKSGTLELPLSLNYHAGGNKVESIASWVGLGWNLGTIPSISRSVRGIPDENGGFFNKYSGKTVRELAQLIGTDINPTLARDYAHDLYVGTTDSEPDIFFYNLLGESGKFFYDQDIEDFITFPKSNTTITRDGASYRLITQDGTEYIFNKTETTSSQGATDPGPPVTSSWFASKMISANKNDTITFSYSLESQLYRTKTVTTKYHYLVGLPTTPPPDAGSITTINTISAMRLQRITFRNGYIDFNENAIPRDDLQNSHSLDNISIYNSHDDLVKKYQFIYHYTTGGGGISCNSVNSFTRTWMFLDTVAQISANDGEELVHSFDYKETNLPCRLSAAQDYWGYYNGENSNIDLTPSVNIPGSDPPAQIPGADREVDPLKSQIGIIKKITYPTGGYTEFDFENNQASADDLPKQYTPSTRIVSGDEFIDPNVPLSQYNVFEKTFVLNNPPDPLLNNDNPSGGAFVTFTLADPGCDLSGGASDCARFTVEGVSHILGPIDIHDVDHPQRFHLPNGTYKLKASFDQQDPQYHHFVFIAEWQEIDTTLPASNYVGGLRVKEIRSYTGSSAQPLIKKYKYTTGYNSIISSGDVFSKPNFSFSDQVVFVDPTNAAGGIFAALVLRIRSISNIQQVSHSGSYVGYKNVIEETVNPDETGYTEYQFSHVRNVLSTAFPYPPSVSFELDRGQLIEESHYMKSGNDFVLKKRRELTYHKQLDFTNDTTHTFALKWGNTHIGNIAAPAAQVFTSYLVLAGWSNIMLETVTNYANNNSIEKITRYYYDNPDHLLPTRIKVYGSNGDQLLTEYKYPGDYATISSEINALITANKINVPVETISSKNGKVISAQGVAHKESDLLPEQFYTYPNPTNTPFTSSVDGENFSSYETGATIISRDNKGNIQEYVGRDGTSNTIIWGYSKSFPIAKIENASYVEIQSEVAALQALSNADDDNCTSPACKEQQLRVALNNLRSLSGLEDAMITTYTYDPLVGMTSQTDPNGQTVYYEYDAFNRLKQVRDFEENILVQHDYNYKNE